MTTTDKTQMCLACGAAPATSTDGTVPLCASCAQLAAEKKRGVEFDKKSSSTTTP